MGMIAVVFGGPSPEHDISILTGLQAALALDQRGHDVCCLYWTKSGTWLRVAATLDPDAFLEPTPPGAAEVELTVPGGFAERGRRKSTPLTIDAVLNCCHGGPGEDGSLTALLALAGLRVTGPEPEVAAIAMDKLATARLAEAAGVPTIETAFVSGEAHGALPQTPWVAKPRFGGSSIGVEADIDDLDTVRALGQSGVGRAGMIVQPFLKGWVDLNIAVRTHPTVELSAIERPLRTDSTVYGYQDKYLTGGVGMDAAPRELPAVIPETIAETIHAHTRSLVDLFGLTGAPRIDYLWDGADQLLLCEINSIPGAWGNHLWQASGVAREVLYADLVAEAMNRPRVKPQWSATSDGRALRVSGSIASKLS